MGKKRKTLRRPCSDETRFQGIATGCALALIIEPLVPCSDETRFQGIATFSDIKATSSFLLSSCSDETRFQGIATSSPPLP